MLNQLRPALVMLIGMTVLTGLAYPLAITGLAGLVFPYQAGGSLLVRNGTVVGSPLNGGGAVPLAVPSTTPRRRVARILAPPVPRWSTA